MKRGERLCSLGEAVRRSQKWTWKWKHVDGRVLAVLHWEVLERRLLVNRSHLASYCLFSGQ